MKFPPYQLQAEKEMLQHIQQRWEDFREERDAYILKKWGYEHPASAVTPISEGNFLVAMYTSFTRGNRGIVSSIISNRSTSWMSPNFRKYWATKNPYVSTTQIKQGHSSNRENRLKKGTDNLPKISPDFLLQTHTDFAVGAITDTDRESYQDFIGGARSYKRQVVDYLSGKKRFFRESMVFQRSRGSGV